MKSKKWVKPELIILVRGDSGESVLGVCKLGPMQVIPQPTDPTGLNYDCADVALCANCNAFTAT
jgi:hypothetical protein